METALRVLGAFVLFDLILGVLLILLAAISVRRRSAEEHRPYAALLGALVFLAIVGLLIYGGLWLCLRAAG